MRWVLAACSAPPLVKQGPEDQGYQSKMCTEAECLNISCVGPVWVYVDHLAVHHSLACIILAQAKIAK